jgi:lipopolysaccharide transport system ATP-binding protein
MMAELVRALVGAKEETIPSSDRNEVVVSAKNISKKFCKTLKRSMAYGIAELSKNLMSIKPDSTELRKDEFWAVDDVSFKLRRGEVLGLIGVNGSGKSTLLRLLAGIFPPDRGEISVKGNVGALIAIGAGFHPHMTGSENIYLKGTILGMTREEIDSKFQEIVNFAEISDFLDAPVSTYSSGMRMRLGFAIAAHINPDVLLIDEVLAVGDVGFRGKCINAINSITKNAAVIFVSHQLSEIARICTKIIVLHHGKAVYQENDINLGIEHYYSLLGNVESSFSGSGKALIHDIKLYSDNGEEAPEGMLKITYLLDLYIEISFSLDSEISKSIMNIGFFTRDMRVFAQCYSKNCDFEIVNNGSVIKTRVKIPKLQFNPGIYFIAITLTDAGRNELLIRQEAAKTIQVAGPFIGHAPIQLQAEWKYVH